MRCIQFIGVYCTRAAHIGRWSARTSDAWDCGHILCGSANAPALRWDFFSITSVIRCHGMRQATSKANVWTARTGNCIAATFLSLRLSWFSSNGNCVRCVNAFCGLVLPFSHSWSRQRHSMTQALLCASSTRIPIWITIRILSSRRVYGKWRRVSNWMHRCVLHEKWPNDDDEHCSEASLVFGSCGLSLHCGSLLRIYALRDITSDGYSGAWIGKQ